MKYILILVVFLSSVSLEAQEVEDLSRAKNLFIQDEISLGAKISTNGWGMDFRNGYFINMKQKKLYEIGFNTIHHPKEYKLSSLYYPTKSFVYGKLNDCYDIKGGYGRQILLFDKKEPGSVAIRIFFFGGVDLAFLKPIYYSVIINNTGDTQEMKYNSGMQPALITEKASFSKGFNEISFDPGVYVKLGTSFEHSKEVNVIRSLELGIESYFFLDKLNIMGDVNNPRLIVSMFISYRIGALIKNRQKRSDKKKK